MSWFLWTVLHGIAFSLQQIIHRTVLRKEKDTLAYWFIYQAIVTLTLLPFASRQNFSVLPSMGYLGIIGSSILSGLFLYLTLKAYNYIEVSEATVISQTKIVWIFILAVVLLKEGVNLNKILGTAIVFLALIVTYFHSKIKINYGALLILLSTIIFAFKGIVDKFTLGYIPVPLFVFAISLFPVLFLSVFARDIFSRSVKLVKRAPILILTSLLATFSLFAIMQAVSLGEISQVTPVAQAFNIVTIMGGIVLLDEKSAIPQKLAGGIFATIGVILIRLS